MIGVTPHMGVGGPDGRHRFALVGPCRGVRAVVGQLPHPAEELAPVCTVDETSARAGGWSGRPPGHWGGLGDSSQMPTVMTV
jgi:hypothetical protein